MKVSTSILKFDSHLRPSVTLGVREAQSHAVGKLVVNSLNVETKSLADQAEKKNDAEFVNRSTV
jgi:hypothetical protein